jgi:tripartite-type tricarboxylate transporter receptor subunit TctC
MVPAGTPKAVIAKIHQDTVAALKDAAIAKRFNDLGMDPVGNTPEAFAAAIREEGRRWVKIIKERKLQVS